MKSQTAPVRVLVLFALSLLALPSVAAESRARIVTVTGTIHVAALDSAVELTDDSSIGFLTDSAEAKIIFASCKEGDLCEVTGKVTGNGVNAFFVHVSKAVFVRRAK